MASPSSAAGRRVTTIGVPKEVKPQENRVGLTPDGVAEYTARGHKVYIETNAGVLSGFPDAQYVKEGAEILPSGAAVYEKAQMIIKVKEPLPCEYSLIRQNQIVYTFFHFAASRELTEAMIKTNSVCIAYETIELNGTLPLLLPMSEVAGRMAIQQGAKYLERAMGGRGILLGGVTGVKPAKVLIIGGGVVGTEAAKVAAGMGARVSVLDINHPRMRYITDILPRNVRVLYNTRNALLDELKHADVVVGAVLVPGRKAPKLVKRDDLKIMKPRSVIVDVAVDQGGCIETVKPTTHENPTFVEEGVLHYCVANMPGAVPYTSTAALTLATLRYGLAVADYGWIAACAQYPELKSGLNVVNGAVTYRGVAEAFDMDYKCIDDVIQERTLSLGDTESPGVQI